MAPNGNDMQGYRNFGVSKIDAFLVNAKHSDAHVCFIRQLYCPETANLCGALCTQSTKAFSLVFYI